MSAECRYIVVKLKWWCGGFFRGESCTLGNPLQQSVVVQILPHFRAIPAQFYGFRLFPQLVHNQQRNQYYSPHYPELNNAVFLVEYLRASIAP